MNSEMGYFFIPKMFNALYSNIFSHDIYNTICGKTTAFPSLSLCQLPMPISLYFIFETPILLPFGIVLQDPNLWPGPKR